MDRRDILEALPDGLGAEASWRSLSRLFRGRAVGFSCIFFDLLEDNYYQCQCVRYDFNVWVSQLIDMHATA